MAKNAKIAPFLWFDGCKGRSAQDAMRFYLKVFKGRCGRVQDKFGLWWQIFPRQLGVLPLI